MWVIDLFFLANFVASGPFRNLPVLFRLSRFRHTTFPSIPLKYFVFLYVGSSVPPFITDFKYLSLLYFFSPFGQIC